MYSHFSKLGVDFFASIRLIKMPQWFVPNSHDLLAWSVWLSLSLLTSLAIATQSSRYCCLMLFPGLVYLLTRAVISLRSNDPYGVYKYSPLQNERSHIRLLHIEPRPSNAILNYRMVVTSLDDPDLPYCALSYSWGWEATDQDSHPLRQLPLRKTLGSFSPRIRQSLDPRSRVIRVNGRHMRISSETERALRVCTEHRKGLPVWVDDICINQDDVLERNNQVCLMHRIYKGADYIAIWLRKKQHRERPWLDTANARIQHIRPGPEQYDSECEEEGFGGRTHLIDSRPAKLLNPETLCQSAHSKSSASCLTSGHASLTTHGNSGCETLDAESLTFLGDLLDTGYFSRLWSIQELVLARRIVFIYDGSEIDLKTVKHHVRACEAHIQSSDSCPILDQLPETTLKSIIAFSHFIRTLKSVDVETHPDLVAQRARLDLLPLIWRFRSHSCQNPRDRIYALLSLRDRWSSSTDMRDLPIRYDLPVEAVYKMAARHLLESTNSLDFLLGTTTKSHELRKVLPSWVPDWTQAPPDGELARLERRNLYRACMGTIPHALTHESMGVLEVVGVVFDTIVTVCEVMPSTGSERKQEILEAWRNTAVIDPTYTGQKRYQSSNYSLDGAYRRTICMNTVYAGYVSHPSFHVDLHDTTYEVADPDLYTEWDNWDREFSLQELLQNLLDSENLLTKAVLRASDSVAITTPSAGRRDGIDMRLERFRRRGTIARCSKRSVHDDLPARRDISIATATASQRLFLTEKGYMGLAPEQIQPGDRIAVLYGCRLPLVLRSAHPPNRRWFTSKIIATALPEDADAHFELIGDCYVQGVMDGEVIEMPDSVTRKFSLV